MALIWCVAVGEPHSVVLATPVGGLRLTFVGEVLAAMDFCDAAEATDERPASAYPPAVARTLAALHAYFHQADAPLRDIPLRQAGTAYQRRVWQRLADIPSGRVVSYGQLAQELGSGPRAVAAACRANPYPLIVPCHRVVAASGLGGYCGARDGAFLDIKRWLLIHEGSVGHA